VGRTARRPGRPDGCDSRASDSFLTRSGLCTPRGPAGARLELIADARSVDTGDPARNEQLRSLAGFDVDAYPQVRFSSTSVRQVGDGTLQVEGRLEAGGKVVPVRFDARLHRAGAGLELDGSWKVTDSMSATVHVAVFIRDAG
jgi:polyisoprenoid-binding protein YceI